MLSDKEIEKLTTEWADALNMAFNDFVVDTGCFPDCFEWRGGKGKLAADFEVGNFTRQAVIFFLFNRRDNEAQKQSASPTNAERAEICSKLKTLSKYPDDYPMKAMKTHLAEIVRKLSPVS